MKLNLDQFNTKLYQEGTIDSGDFIFKEEIIDYIIEKMKFQGDSEYEKGYSSNNYYIPDEPSNSYIKATGTLLLSVIENKYGSFNEGDSETLEHELNENEEFQTYLKEILNDHKSFVISNFQLGNTTIMVDSKSIIVEVEADDIELNKNY